MNCYDWDGFSLICFFLNFLGMTAIALSPNRRYLAVAERGDKPSVTIYDLQHDQSKKRKASVISTTLEIFCHDVQFFDGIDLE